MGIVGKSTGYFFVACVVFCVATSSVIAATASIELTSDALGLGSSQINYQANNSYVEADRPGKLVTSTASNIGSVLSIQTDNIAGQGDTLNPLMVTVTARSHMDIQTNLPANYDIHAGVITLTNNTGSLASEGLGVRAFGLDSDIASSNYGRRYNDGTGNGFGMEGSKEVSGGVDYVDWLDFVAANPIPPDNSPPHVDEDVLFDFNLNQIRMPANGITVLLTSMKAGTSNNPFDTALDLTINLVGGSSIFQTFNYLSDDPGIFSLLPGYADVIRVDFSSSSLGLGPTDIIDSFIIGARDDPADPIRGTDEHLLVNGFSADYTIVPEPATMIMLALGGLALRRKQR